MTMFNELNLSYSVATCGSYNCKLVDYGVDPMISYSQLNLGLNSGEFNDTMQQVMDFKKPENINFNFDFFKSIDIGRMLYNTLISTVWGFPFYLGILGMPSLFVYPLLLMMELSHLIVLIYILLGKSF